MKNEKNFVLKIVTRDFGDKELIILKSVNLPSLSLLTKSSIIFPFVSIIISPNRSAMTGMMPNTKNGTEVWKRSMALAIHGADADPICAVT